MGETDRFKQSLRERMQTARGGISEAQREAHHRAMAEALLTLAQARSASFVGVYAATPTEASAAPFIAAWTARGGRFAWPRVAGEELHFHLIEGPGGLAPGFRGIDEPLSDTPESAVETLDLLIVPGLAFDSQGGRLGMGGGHYDRLLSAPLRPFAVGLAYACQLVDEVPAVSHDRRVDCVLTENGLVV
jgi:5-formyltetrahydrofolate cyclo-ligase